MAFNTPKEAVEFLATRIAEEASFSDVHLSEPVATAPVLCCGRSAGYYRANPRHKNHAVTASGIRNVKIEIAPAAAQPPNP